MEQEDVQLSQHFTLRKLFRFTLPSMVMMMFSSIYSVVDGIFISNYIGKTPFAAVNLIMPFLMMFGVIGYMIGTGGSALIAKTIGEGRRDKANHIFSMLVYTLIGVGLLLTVLGQLFIEQIAHLLGADGQLAADSVTYGRVILLAMTAFILQSAFQAFFVTADKPNLGLGITIAAGVSNMALDWLFIAVMGWGLQGAAWATAISQMIGGLIPLAYFALPNKSLLRLGGCRWNNQSLVKSLTNGSSELVTNLSMSLVVILYNLQLMRYIGEDGVAAFGIIMYVSFIFQSIYLGYAMGSAPIVSYNDGADNRAELRNVRRKSLQLIGMMGIVLTLSAELLAPTLAGIFVGYDAQLHAMTTIAFHIYSLSFLLSGYNVYASSFFTALNNGLVSAAMSFTRTMVFEMGAVLVMPLLFGIDGIWGAIVVAEVLALVMASIIGVMLLPRYRY